MQPFSYFYIEYISLIAKISTRIALNALKHILLLKCQSSLINISKKHIKIVLKNIFDDTFRLKLKNRKLSVSSFGKAYNNHQLGTRFSTSTLLFVFS